MVGHVGLTTSGPGRALQRVRAQAKARGKAHRWGAIVQVFWGTGPQMVRLHCPH